MRGSVSSARAMAMRCFCPPDRVTPRSPTFVSYRSGRSSMKARICAASAAASISAGEASGRPKAMFSPMVAANSTVSCSTTPI